MKRKNKYRSGNLESLRVEREKIKESFTPAQNALLLAMKEHRVSPTIEYIQEEFGSDFFANITLDAQHNRLVGGYNEVPTSWMTMSNPVPANDFKLRHAVAASGFDDLDTVLENGQYQMHRIEDEDRGTYSLVKRGNIFGLTLEAQANDELSAFAQKMAAEGRAAARTLDKFAVTTNLDANPTIYDGVALIHANHNNTNGALSEATLRAAIEGMQTQTGIKTDEEIQIQPHTLLVHPAQQWLAMELLESSLKQASTPAALGLPDKNVMKGMVPNLKVSVRMTAGRSVLLANPAVMDMFELGFYRGNQAPELFTEDPGSPSEFDSDVNRWKVRHIYSGTWRDFRGVQGFGY